MAITDWPPTERPREKLLQRGAASLSDAELLAILLRTGTKGKTALDLSRQLLKEYGGLRSLLQTSKAKLKQLKGIGPSKSALLLTLSELTHRVANECLPQRFSFKDLNAVKRFLQQQLRSQTNETFACLFMDGQQRLLHFERLFQGTIDHAKIYPRELLKRTLEYHATNIIISHNHPSGIAKPSQSDLRLTKALHKHLRYFGISLIDHIIVGERHCYSFNENGLLL